MPPLYSSKGRKAFKSQMLAKLLPLCSFIYPNDCFRMQLVLIFITIFVMASARNPSFLLFRTWTICSEMLLWEIRKKERTR